MKKIIFFGLSLLITACTQYPGVQTASPRIVKSSSGVTLYQSTGGFYYADRAPQSTESAPFINNLVPSWWWLNTSTNDLYWNLNPANGSLTYMKMITDLNISANLPGDVVRTENFSDNLPINLQDTQIGIARDYSALSSPAFNTAYQPSTTHDVKINAMFSLTSTLVTAADLIAEVNAGNGYGQIGECGLSGLLATTKCTLSFIVPIGATYRFTQVSGSSSIVSVKKLDL